jgi:hypothetical protein
MDPATIAGYGSLLSGAGSVIGAISGGDDINRKWWYEQFQAQRRAANAAATQQYKRTSNLMKQQAGQQRRMTRWQWKNAFGEQARAAKRAGFHPLYALGNAAISPAAIGLGSASSAATPSLPAGQYSSGSGASDALSGIGSALSGYAQSKQAKIQAERDTIEWGLNQEQRHAQIALTNKQKDFVQEQINASKAKRGQVDSIGHPSGPAAQLQKYEDILNKIGSRESISTIEKEFPEIGSMWHEITRIAKATAKGDIKGSPNAYLKRALSKYVQYLYSILP